MKILFWKDGHEKLLFIATEKGELLDPSIFASEQNSSYKSTTNLSMLFAIDPSAASLPFEEYSLTIPTSTFYAILESIKKDTLPIPKWYVHMLGENIKHRPALRYSWAHWWRIKIINDERFRPIAFTQPANFPDDPTILKPVRYICNALGRHDEILIEKLWEETVDRSRSYEIEILSNTRANWLQIFGKTAPVKTCMTVQTKADEEGNIYYTNTDKARKTAAFYTALGHLCQPCLLKSSRRVIGRTIIWSTGEIQLHDRIYCSSAGATEIFEQKFKEQNIEAIERYGGGFFLYENTLKEISKIGWIPYMDQLCWLVCTSDNILITTESYVRSFIENTKYDSENKKLTLVHLQKTNGNHEAIQVIRQFLRKRNKQSSGIIEL